MSNIEALLLVATGLFASWGVRSMVERVRSFPRVFIRVELAVAAIAWILLTHTFSRWGATVFWTALIAATVLALNGLIETFRQFRQPR